MRRSSPLTNGVILETLCRRADASRHGLKPVRLLKERIVSYKPSQFRAVSFSGRNQNFGLRMVFADPARERQPVHRARHLHIGEDNVHRLPGHEDV